MNHSDLLKLIPFPLVFDTEAGSYDIPNIVTIKEAILAPELDRDFALRTLCAYPNILQDLDASVLRDAAISILKGILARNSPDLWDELTEELLKVKYNRRLYAMFCLHRYRREFITEQPYDIESQIAFYQWSAGRTFRMFSNYIIMGGEYKIVDGIVRISSSLHRYRANYFFYLQSMLPVPLKYLPSNKFMYKNRHEIQNSINKSLGLKTPSNYPVQLKGEKFEDFEKRQKTYQKELNKESLHHANLFSRFTASGEIYSYLNGEGRSETVKLVEQENRFLEAVEDYENRRRQEIRQGKKSKPNIEIINDLLGWDESILSISQINDLQEWNPDKLVLSQCQFCYRYEIAEPKNTRPAWHCGRPVCESAYRKWVDRLKSKKLKLKDLWVI